MMNSEIIIYQNPDGNIKIDVRLDEETVWLTQDQMATLFGKAKSTINEHIKNVYEENELQEAATMKKFGISEFQQKAFNYYNLDVSIAKNYLNEDEIKLLGLLVEQYLAFAETMAQQRTPMYMNDWRQRLDSILQLNGRELLTHAGKINHEKALQKSKAEFEKYKIAQKAIEKEQSLKEIENDIKKLKKTKQ